MIPFSPPRIDQRIIDAVTDTLKSGWITTGPKTKLFEKKITEYSGNKTTLCLNSATAGLELMLRWFGVKEGDEVIVPAYTYCATANVIIHCGATPVFADNETDFNISAKTLEKLITPKTKVIIPVDIAGFPCDYDKINELVNKQEIKIKFNPNTEEQKQLGRILIMSDSAHSFGAIYKNHRSGSLIDITVFSFHAVKNLTTAEGGAVCLNLPAPFDNEAIYKKLCIKSLHGQNKDALEKFKAGNWKYDVVEAGYKYNMTDMQAAIGLVELERYDDDMLKKRERIFNLYSELLSKFDWAEIPSYKTNDKTSSFHAYLLRIKGINESQRDQIIQHIFEKEVSVNVHFIPIPMFTYYKSLGYSIKNFPVSFENYAHVISLPVFYNLTEEQVKTVVTAVSESVEQVIK